MNHFFTAPENIRGNEIRLEGSCVNHIKNVLRLKPGEEISVSDGVSDKEYRCGIERFEEDAVVCSLRFIKEAGCELPVRISLFQGLPKGDKMELIVQKAVELGAAEIIPVATARSVVKLDEKKAAKKTEHWQGIADSAAEQSRRSIVPRVGKPISMKEAAGYASEMELAIIPYELAEGLEGLRDFMKQLKALPEGARAAVFIGPEGGFAEEEIALAEAAGIRPVSLGRRILRTETAGMAVLAMMMYEVECKES
ncbi:MAG: 16S rRNA (uracil(1498)-N(3))-methyltransferase [Lachnospiraceae bacterium]|nr:16S rRNA (uracil(1498)-N(3))-methyltransferase [Lachnospiraceae bacterium]